jgi:hypothetical protein
MAYSTRPPNTRPPTTVHRVAPVFDAWASTRPDLVAPGIALALRAALATVKDLRELSAIEIAWTGLATGLVVAR